MLKPAYIIVASEVIQDKTTNLVSIFNVIETVVVGRSGVDERLSEATIGRNIKVVAVWMGVDESGALEHQFVIRPPGLPPRKVPPQPFDFDGSRCLRRFILKMTGIPAVNGIVEIESRVRKQGENWHTQSFPLVIQVDAEKVVENATSGQPA